MCKISMPSIMPKQCECILQIHFKFRKLKKKLSAKIHSWLVGKLTTKINKLLEKS
jgi:hypothetical protein